MYMFHWKEKFAALSIMSSGNGLLGKGCTSENRASSYLWNEK